MKKCFQCGNNYPATDEFFYRAKGNADGLNRACKSCKRQYINEYRQKHLEQVRQSAREYQQRVYNSRYEYKKKYNDEHCAEIRKYQHQYYEEHKKKRNAKSRQWSTEHPERRRAIGRKWYRTHREVANARKRIWKNENPEKLRASKHRRRAREFAAEGHWTPDDITKLYKLQKGKCWWRGPDCAIDLSKGYHIDHRIPLAKGGTNWPSNLVLTCPHCNLSKHAKLPDEFNGRLL